MNRAERVQAAIMYPPPDQVPVGELIIEPSLAVSQGGAAMQQIEVAHRLGLDAVCVPADEEVVKVWAASKDCFLFALVDGPFETFLAKRGFMEGLQAIRENPEELRCAPGKCARGRNSWGKNASTPGRMGSCWRMILLITAVSTFPP